MIRKILVTGGAAAVALGLLMGAAFVVPNGGGGAGVSDGDKGDVSISGSGSAYDVQSHSGTLVGIGAYTNRSATVYVEDPASPGVPNLFLYGSDGGPGVITYRDTIGIGFLNRVWQFESNANRMAWANTPYGNIGMGTSYGVDQIAASNFLAARTIRLMGVTASRALVANGQGDVTNASGTADTTTFLRGDNTYAVPPGGSATPDGGDRAIQFSLGGAFAGTNQFFFDRSNSFVGLNLAGRTPRAGIELGGSTTQARTMWGSGTSTSRVDYAGIYTDSAQDLQLGANGNKWYIDDVTGAFHPGAGTSKAIGLPADGITTVYQHPTNSTATSFTFIWPGPDFIRWAPTGAGTITDGGAPSAGDAPQRKHLWLYTQQSVTFPAGWITRDGTTPFLASGITNRLVVEFDGTNIFVESLQMTKAIAASATAGTGTSSTNVTVQANGARRQYLNAGLTNLALIAVMGGQAAAHDAIVLIATNRHSAVCSMDLRATTNNFVNVGSLAAPFLITNALWLSTETIGTNTFYAARYLALPAP